MSYFHDRVSDRLERELSEVGFREQDSLMQSLRDKLTKFHKERALSREEMEKKDTELTQMSEYHINHMIRIKYI